jgi:hypothetical protein
MQTTDELRLAVQRVDTAQRHLYRAVQNLKAVTVEAINDYEDDLMVTPEGDPDPIKPAELVEAEDALTSIPF